MCDQPASPDVRIAAIADRQHGVVSVRQLRKVGLDKHRVRHRVRTARLHPVHRGVYAVGHSHLSAEGRWMAAVLAYGAGAVLSHRSAAALWGLLPNKAGLAVEISVQGYGGKSKRASIHLHRRSSLEPRCVTRRHGIPVTTAARTVADLRRTVSPTDLRRAIRQADALGLALGPNSTPDGTRSELEFRFLELCRQWRLPSPDVNARIGSRVVDFAWPRNRLVVETDGYRYHRGRLAFEDDRARDLELRTLRYEVVRLTYRQVLDNPEAIGAVLKRLLEGESSAPR